MTTVDRLEKGDTLAEVVDPEPAAFDAFTNANSMEEIQEVVRLVYGPARSRFYTMSG